MLVTDKETGEVSKKTVKLTKDEGNRPDTNLAGLAKLQPVAGPTSGSPPATPASSPTAPPPAWS